VGKFKLEKLAKKMSCVKKKEKKKKSKGKEFPEGLAKKGYTKPRGGVLMSRERHYTEHDVTERKRYNLESGERSEKDRGNRPCQ